MTDAKVRPPTSDVTMIEGVVEVLEIDAPPKERADLCGCGERRHNSRPSTPPLGATEIEVQNFLDSYDLVLNGVVTVDATISRDAFVVGCRTPERLPFVDALIAASARAAGCMLVHRDVHMRAIPDGLVHKRELAGP